MNRELSVITRVLRWTEEVDLIARNPVKRITKEAEVKRTPFLSIEAWQRFREAFDDPEKWTQHVESIRWLGDVKANPAKGTERRYGGALTGAAATTANQRTERDAWHRSGRGPVH